MNKKVDLSKYTPIKNYFVGKNQPKEKSVGGIILIETDRPEDQGMPFAEIEIVKVGPEVTKYKPGDHVLVSWNYCFNSAWKEDEGEESDKKLVTHYLLKEDMILMDTK